MTDKETLKCTCGLEPRHEVNKIIGIRSWHRFKCPECQTIAPWTHTKAMAVKEFLALLPPAEATE